MQKLALACVVAFVACGPSNRGNGSGGDDSDGGGGSGGSGGSGGGSYTVYADSDTVLYSIDLASQSLVTVGPFDAPNNDTMTDLAVAPDGTIYVISETELYTANPGTGQATAVGSLSTCGADMVALTTLPDGTLWTGDFKGALCQIDLTTSPPTVKPAVTMGNAMALTGDFAAVSNGTVFGTAYRLDDGAGSGTQANNLLVTLDVVTGAVTTIGSTGFPELYGVAFAQGKVFGFTHDGTGRVATIDTTTGVGSLFGTFTDPTTSKGIAFAGAGVSSLVTIE